MMRSPASATLSRSVIVMLGTVGLCLIGLDKPGSAGHLDYEGAPIHYSTATPDNQITELQNRIDSGDLTLNHDERFGYLPALLKELQIDSATQLLLFSRTSLQRPLISPQRPRALYFNDNAYVGYVADGVLEAIVFDAELGLVFYTLDQKPVNQPRFVRETNRCLSCHERSRTRNIPGLLARSVYTAPDGEPVLAAGSFRTEQASPFKERWGGWYVTGRHGDAVHLGNFTLTSSKRPTEPIENLTGLNRTDVTGMFDSDRYLTPHSDLAALLVFEHQLDAHNYLARTLYAARIHASLPQSSPAATTAWEQVIQEADRLVEHLLFTDEAPLQFPVSGTSSFAENFQNHRDEQGNHNSLRRLNLKSRVFQQGCSYVVSSQAFQNLPKTSRDYVVSRIVSRLQDASGATSSRYSPIELQGTIEALHALLSTSIGQ